MLKYYMLADKRNTQSNDFALKAKLCGSPCLKRRSDEQHRFKAWPGGRCRLSCMRLGRELKRGCPNARHEVKAYAR
eukprot:2895310-Pyramimonas_sp.AAC.1